MALYGHSMAATMTYYLHNRAYFLGYGLGNCYIAELFQDFSYLGVFLGNVILGFLIKKIKSLKKNNIITNFLLVYLITVFLRLPRDSYDIIIDDFIGLKNILFVIFIITITSIIYHNQTNKEGNE